MKIGIGLLVFGSLLMVLPAGVRGQAGRPGVGAIPYADAEGTGVTFRVWAPNASSVTVAGDFNGWNTGSDLLVPEGNGYWSSDKSNVSVGAQYKYVINGTLWRKDPRGLQVVNSNDNSIVFDPTQYDWSIPSFTPPARKDLVLYEMHVRTFNPISTLSPQGTFDTALDKLDHLQALGINGIQLMPISEFSGDNSWGYNPSDPYAVESAYGGPQALQRFIDICHTRGFAVYLDVVHNHWGPSDLATWQFDGWGPSPDRGGIYHYNQDGLCCTQWGATRPDYGRVEVRDYILGNYVSFLDNFHCDGFRTDSAYHMGYYGFPGTQIPDGISLMQDINNHLHANYPNILSIQENGDANWGFDAQWDMTFQERIRAITAEPSDAGRDMNELAGLVNNGAGLGRVNYIESHDTAGDLNGNTRIARLIDASDPTSFWARKRALLAATLSLTSPGTPMIFQGEEMHETWSFSDNTGFRWDMMDHEHHQGSIAAYRDLVHARRNLRGGTVGLEGTGCHVHHIDNSNKVIAYKRWDAGGDDVVVVINFGVTAWTNHDYFIEFPVAGTWYAHFNSDRTEYGADFNNIGDAAINASGSTPAAAVNMGRYSAIVFSQTPPSVGGIAWTTPDEAVGCDGELAIHYRPESGPLGEATPIQVAVGHDGWQAPFDSVMTQSPSDSNEWIFTYSGVPGGTRGINFAFHSGAGTWDSNFGKDWYAQIDCHSNAGSVWLDPSQPNGCDPITIFYDPLTGPLAGSAAIHLYIGVDSWQNVQTVPMTQDTAGVWSTVYVPPGGVDWIHFVFNDGVGGWDNNYADDWNYSVFCPPVGDIDGDGMPDTWEGANGLVVGLNDALLDKDGDGMKNLHELIADTHANDPASYLGISDVVRSNQTIRVYWHGGQAARQILQGQSGLSPSGTWQGLLTNHPPTPVQNLTDMTTEAADVRFFRVVVDPD